MINLFIVPAKVAAIFTFITLVENIQNANEHKINVFSFTAKQTFQHCVRALNDTYLKRKIQMMLLADNCKGSVTIHQISHSVLSTLLQAVWSFLNMPKSEVSNLLEN